MTFFGYDGREGKEIAKNINSFFNFFGSVVNFVILVSFQYGEFLQNVVNFSGVVNKKETHQSTVIRNGTVLPYINVLYIVNWTVYV